MSQRITKRLGQMPIMVKSKACYLRNLKRADLVRRGEEANEFGGYFVCNGIERIIRMLVQQRRHYVMALRRGAYHKRGPSFTEMATLVRCVRPDETSLTNRCHYLADGTVVFAITIRRSEYFVPAGILLKCFLEVSDKELYAKLVGSAGQEGGHAGFVAERAELLLRQAARYNLHTRAQCLEYLGSLFRVAFDLPERKTDYQVGEHLLRTQLFIHLEAAGDKLQLGIHMLLKLYALVSTIFPVAPFGPMPAAAADKNVHPCCRRMVSAVRITLMRRHTMKCCSLATSSSSSYESSWRTAWTRCDSRSQGI